MLGDMPGLVSGRSTPNYVDVVTSGRQAQEAFAREAEGSRAFGEGVSRFGRGLQEYGESQYAKEERLNGAMATANSTIYEDNVKAALENETDPAKIRQLLSNLDQGYASAGSNLSGDQAALFSLQSQHRANSLRLAGEKRIKYLNEQSYMASAEGTINDLQSAFIRGDRETQKNALESAGKIFDYMAENGYMTPQKAEENKNLFARGAVMQFIQNQPVNKQFELLGVSTPGKVAAKDLQPYQAAFLNAIAGPESAGKYNIRYGGIGSPGVTFNDFSRHPNVLETTKEGQKSSAAGRYQFTGTTWNNVSREMGIADFRPENQDHAALYLARQVYKKQTGEDLDQELKSNGVSEKVINALGSTWRGLQDNPRKARSWYKATLDGSPNAEGSYEIASSNNNYPLHPEDHAKLVNNAFAIKKKELDLANAQEKAEIEQANEQFYTRLTDNKLDNLLDDIQNDPVLRQHPKEQLQMMDVAKRHIESMTKNKGNDYGEGYTEGFDGVMKGDITTNEQLYEMAKEGKLTVHGVNQLKTMIGDLRSKPEKAVEQKVIAGQLAYAKNKLKPMGGLIAGQGDDAYNSTFIPAFYSRYNAWVKAGKDPYEFLTKENTDKLIKEIKPDALSSAQNRVIAGVEDRRPAQAAPETILPPPAGINVPPEKWNGVMQMRPNAPSGKPLSLVNWSSAVRDLVKSPNEATRRAFDAAFAPLNARKILEQLGVPPQ